MWLALSSNTFAAVVLSQGSPDVAGTYPALAVEFAWGVASSGVPGPGDWVDESDYVKSLSTKVGAEDEFTQPSAGSLTLTLDGTSGRFDPDNTTSPLYGDLRPLTWVRVMGGTTSANRGVFYGQVSIEGFRLNASQFAGAIEVDVTVLDALEQLANSDLPGSVYEIEVQADSPVAWYRLGESSGTVAVDSSGNGHHGTYEGGATFNSRAGLIANDANNAIGFDGVDDGVLGPHLALGSAFTFETWVEEDSVPTNSWAIVAVGNENPYSSAGFEPGTPGGVRGAHLGIEVDSAPGPGSTGHYLGFLVGDGTGARLFRATADVEDLGLFDGETHHLVATYSSGTGVLYIDNEVVASTTYYSSGPTPTPTPGPVGVARAIGIYSNVREAATLDEVAVYDTALSAARVAAHYTAGTEPLGEQLTGARAESILDAIAWPVGQRNIDTGNTTMPPADWQSGDALSALQATSTGEGGLLYVDHYDSGKVRLEDRHARLTESRSTTSQATFGDGGGSEVPYTRIELQDDRIINSATMQRSGGSAVTAGDAASQTVYQERDFSLTGLLTTSDAEVASRASALVAEKKDRHRRVRSIVVEPRDSTHLGWGQVFDRRMGDRVTVVWRPPYGGTYSYPCWIIGIAHEWKQSAAAWETTFWLEPVPFDGDAYFIIGTSTIGSNARIGW